MWLPNTDPSGSGLISDVRFRGQEGAAADAPMHSHLGVLGVTGFLMRNLDRQPARLRRRRPAGEPAARVVAVARLDEPRPDEVCERAAAR